MRIRLYKRGKTWWGQGGRDFRKSTGHTDERKARIVANRWERELADPTHYRAHQATVASAAERWVKEMVSAGVNENTRRFYDTKIRHVVAGLGHARLADLTHAKVLAYTEAREKAGAHRHSIHRELTALRLTLKSAMRAGEWGKDVRAVIPRYAAGYTPREEWLTREQVWSVMRELEPPRAAAVAFILATASDRGPAFLARRGDVSAAAVVVRGTKTKARFREVPRVAMFAELLEYALEHADGEDTLLSPWPNMHRDLRRACKRAGVPEITARSLRRTAATWLVRAGVPFEVIAKFLGHASTAMLYRVYGRMGADDIGRLIDERTVPRMYHHTAESGDNADSPDSENTGDAR